MQVHRHATAAYRHVGHTAQAPVRRRAGQHLIEAGRKFLAKYKKRAAINVHKRGPDLSVHQEAMHYDLRGRAPRGQLLNALPSF